MDISQFKEAPNNESESAYNLSNTRHELPEFESSKTFPKRYRIFNFPEEIFILDILVFHLDKYEHSKSMALINEC